MKLIGTAALAIAMVAAGLSYAAAQQLYDNGSDSRAPGYAPYAPYWEGRSGYEPTIADVNGRPARGPGYNPAGSGSGLTGGGFEN